MSSLRTFWVIPALAAALSASAQSTFFPAMPHAEMLSHREFSYSLKAAGNEGNVSKRTGWCQELAAGVNDRFEFTLGNDFLGGSVFGVKAMVYETANPAHFALAAGVCNIPLDKGRMVPYVVARTNPCDRVRLHAGWAQDTENRLMLGADYDLGKGYSAAFE